MNTNNKLIVQNRCFSLAKTSAAMQVMLVLASFVLGVLLDEGQTSAPYSVQSACEAWISW